MLSIGNQTSFSAAPLEPFEYALAHGFDAFEWFPDKRPEGAGWSEADLTAELRREISQKARAAGVRLSVHAPWQANPLEPAAFVLLAQDVALAGDLGAVLLNVHLYHERGIAAYVEAILPLARLLAGAGMQLSVENTPAHAPELFNEFFAALRARDRAAAASVGMCLDLGHANLAAATRNRYLEFVDRLAPGVPIIHVHLHENWGDNDSHLPLFCGPAGRDDSGVRGFLDRLRRRRFAGSIILEQWPQPPTLLNVARARILELLGPRAPAGPSGEPAGRRGFQPSEKEVKPGPGGAGPALKPALRSAPFVCALAASDQGARSWREKLDGLRALLQSGDLTPEALALVAVYLRFLNAGQIRCVEDGRHFRPVHHARAAQEIRQRLAAVAAPQTAFLLRRIEPWLPSSAAPFQRAEPLTRIRDIAHRNDLPQELKREIKETLQNKLHRCAGPEDLVTAEALLKRLVAPGAGFSAEFLEQYKIFCAELREFFNASSLEERLKSLAAAAPEDEARLLAQLQQSRAPSLELLKALTELRLHLVHPGGGATEDEAQQRRLAEIGLETYAFSLASGVINRLESSVPAGGGEWVSALALLRVLTVNLRLGEVEVCECLALEAELRAWSHGFAPESREQLLRLLATVERGRRLAGSFSQRLVRLFAAPALELGRRLGIEERALGVFSEAEIRGHLIFQFSRLCDCLLKWLRSQLRLPPWDVIVGGHVCGRVRVLENLEALRGAGSESALALVARVAGDEEIPPCCVGLLVGEPLPHLSHLAVRARQAGVLLAASEEPSAWQTLKPLADQWLDLRSGADGLQWNRVAAGPARLSRPAANRVLVEAPGPVPAGGDKLCLSLEEVAAAQGGEKAANAARLFRLARESRDAFQALPGVVIPFGVMEHLLQSRPELAGSWMERLRAIEAAAPSELEGRLETLRAGLERLPMPEGLAAALSRHLAGAGRLMVRSSSNCEDRAELAGAGLYESIANVPPAEVAQAVRQVWASLWTRRAVLSRRQSGIPEATARMAVLIQPMLDPELSFILHTVEPVSGDASVVYAEVAPGLGETLASASEPGTPWRLACAKDSARVTTLAFANYSHSLHPARRGAVERRRVNYSILPLSCHAQARQRLGQRLARAGRLVEQACHGPQDIEGALVGDELWLVQTRPQQGLGPKG